MPSTARRSVTSFPAGSRLLGLEGGLVLLAGGLVPHERLLPTVCRRTCSVPSRFRPALPRGPGEHRWRLSPLMPSQRRETSSRRGSILTERHAKIAMRSYRKVVGCRSRLCGRAAGHERKRNLRTEAGLALCRWPSRLWSLRAELSSAPRPSPSQCDGQPRRISCRCVSGKHRVTAVLGCRYAASGMRPYPARGQWSAVVQALGAPRRAGRSSPRYR